jgi:hypothetical protein
MAHGPAIEVLVGWGGALVFGLFAILALIRGSRGTAKTFAVLLLICAILVIINQLPGSTDWFLAFSSAALFWAPPFLLGIVVLFYAGTIRTRDEHAPRCVNCGYNLTGNLSGICPECGKPNSRVPRPTTHSFAHPEVELLPKQSTLESKSLAKSVGYLLLALLVDSIMLVVMFLVLNVSSSNITVYVTFSILVAGIVVTIVLTYRVLTSHFQN